MASLKPLGGSRTLDRVLCIGGFEGILRWAGDRVLRAFFPLVCVLIINAIYFSY